ncbi:MAG: hypothetical protein NTW19_17840 [Planctomycetota bacterium]|nr:hypothetical protein [Planctomycetota bacterium]
MWDSLLGKVGDWVVANRRRFERLRLPRAADVRAAFAALRALTAGSPPGDPPVTWRHWLLQHKGLVAAGAILLLLAFGTGSWSVLRAGPYRREVWFYDLNTNTLFRAPLVAAPIRTSSGPHEGAPAGVRAYVFACRDCGDADDRRAAFLERYAPEAQRAMDSLLARSTDVERVMKRATEDESTVARQRFVKKPDGGKWVDAASAEAEEVTALDATRCPNGALLDCN